MVFSLFISIVFVSFAFPSHHAFKVAHILFCSSFRLFFAVIHCYYKYHFVVCSWNIYYIQGVINRRALLCIARHGVIWRTHLWCALNYCDLIFTRHDMIRYTSRRCFSWRSTQHPVLDDDCEYLSASSFLHVHCCIPMAGFISSFFLYKQKSL